MWYWCSMQFKVVIPLSKCITMAMTALRWSLSVECMERCHVIPGQIECTFVLLRVRLNCAVLFMIDAVWGHPYVLSKYTTMAMTALHALTFVLWMYGTVVMLALDEQHVRLHCYVRACIWRHYCFGMQYEVVISPSCAVQIHCNDDDDGSTLILFVECMERVLCWPWTNSAYVCIAVCVLKFGCSIGVRCNLHDVATSRTILLSQYTT